MGCGGLKEMRWVFFGDTLEFAVGELGGIGF